MTLVAILLCALQSDAVRDEYAERLDRLRRNAAAKHYKVGGYLTVSRMHAWAREQYNKTIEYDPDHETARRRLGYRKTADGWESDPTIKQQFSNQARSARQVERIRESLDRRLERLNRNMARDWVTLGRWCQGKELKEEADQAFRKAIEYDPGNDVARKALGYVKTAKGIWLSKAQQELRAAMRDGIPTADKGEPLDARSPVEERLGFKTRKRRSAHFVVESTHLADGKIADLAQHAEHAFEIYHRLFDREDLFGGRRLTHLILQDKSQHVAYVNAYRRGSAAQMELARKANGSMGFPIAEWCQETSPHEVLQDSVVHTTVQLLSFFNVGPDHHWIHEGTAYHFTRLMKGTAATQCVNLAPSGTENEGKDLRDPEDWPLILKVLVRDGKDPDINAVLKCTNVAELSGVETVKAWSLVSFLLTDHKEKFLELCGELKGGVDVEAALQSVFGWSPADLDARWKAYVTQSY